MKTGIFTRLFIAIIIVGTTITALVFGVWLIAIPEDLIANWIKTSVEKPLVLEIDGLNKEVLFTIKIHNVRLLLKNNELLVLNDGSITINPVFLLFNTAKVSFNGVLSNGYITGSGIIKKNYVSIDGKMGDIELGRLNYLKKYALKGNGILSGGFTLKKDTGQLDFKVKDFAFLDVYSHGIYLPLKYFNKIEGLIILKKEQLTVESITSSGKGVYARIKGKIAKGSTDLKIDIMPDEDFPDKSKLALIKHYEVSPGVYSMEIKKWLY
ncbi:MAG: type II secretion system protein GspN [Nitrospirae bacterium]|nr:type II secretion system protein GspN [Nitrospirota bacterium]